MSSPRPRRRGAAERLARALARIAEPIATLRERLLGRLDEEADDMDAATRNRIEAAGRSLNRRVLMPLSAWQNMARSLTDAPAEPGRRPDQIMFLRLARVEGGREIDVGLHRHWLDPTIPFAATLASPAHGLLVTSATLRDAGDADPESAWESAEARVGAPHLPSPASRATVASPFDYATQTRAFIVTDVFGGDIAQLAAAYRALFIAAGGGALGLFTAIRRLQAVHARIAPDLEEAGIPPYAQHVDAWATPRWSISSAPRRRAAAGPTRARRRRCPRRAAFGGVQKVPKAVPTFSTGNGASIFRMAIKGLTMASRLRCAGRLAGDPAGHRSRCSCCSTVRRLAAAVGIPAGVAVGVSALPGGALDDSLLVVAARLNCPGQPIRFRRGNREYRNACA
jgi:hypothetical protein